MRSGGPKMTSGIATESGKSADLVTKDSGSARSWLLASEAPFCVYFVLQVFKKYGVSRSHVV